MTKDKLMEIKELKKYYPIEKGFLKRKVGDVKAVENISFDILQSETFGLVGESGSGKTTLGKCIVKAHNATEGSITIHFDNDSVDINKLSDKEFHRYRQNIQMIFQDPYSSLNPRSTVFNIISEPLENYKIYNNKKNLEKRVIELIELVGLKKEHLERYPHAFSGGQRQRIGIARALALNPKLVVCDEAVSALDVSVQAQILNLLKDLQQELGLSYLFISHDLGVISHFADRVGVMYAGKIVEISTKDQLFKNPMHPYTEALLSAKPEVDPSQKKEKIILKGEVPNPAHLPAGCSFHPRCKYAKDICKIEIPELRSVDGQHVSACHFSDDIFSNNKESVNGNNCI